MLLAIGWSLCQSACGQSTISHPHAAVPLSQFQQRIFGQLESFTCLIRIVTLLWTRILAINVTSRLTPTDTISLFGGAYWYHTKIINDTSQSA